ncbi:MAG: matrixin family metalloprotease [Myxococcota bacterium]|nr:matrixin family metalloprotease [Myxococcota bacterium]
MNVRLVQASWADRRKRCALGIAVLLFSAAPGAALAQPVACIAEGTPAGRIAEHLVAAAQAGPLAANVGDRWDRTATDGSGISRGEPITLTWSVVPDGTAIDGAPTVGDGSDPSDLRAFLDNHYGNFATWSSIVQAALDGWSDGPGVTFVYEPNDDGLKLSSAQGVDGVRADIRIGGHNIDGNFGTVAYAFFPGGGGDMVIDTADTFNTNQSRLHNVVAHEAGHSIGLGHTCPSDSTKLMEPVITLAFAGPQFDDLLGAHRNYGDEQEENDVVSESADLGLAIDSVTNVTGLALDGTGDDDWYEVPAGSLTEVLIQLDPAGTPYPLSIPTGASCPGGTQPTYDPRDIQDLVVSVYDFDGTTLLASSDAAGIGSGETLDDVRLSTFGGYIEVTNGGGVNDAQAYDIQVTLVPEASTTALRATALLVIAALAHAARRRSVAPR